jgi:hypothetical protein
MPLAPLLLVMMGMGEKEPRPLSTLKAPDALSVNWGGPPVVVGLKRFRSWPAARGAGGNWT